RAVNARAWLGSIRRIQQGRKLLVVGVVSVATSVGVGYALAGRVKPPDPARQAWHGKVVKIVAAASSSPTKPGVTGVTVSGAPAKEGAEIGAGSTIATDERTRARIDLYDGTSVV